MCQWLSSDGIQDVKRNIVCVGGHLFINVENRYKTEGDYKQVGWLCQGKYQKAKEIQEARNKFGLSAISYVMKCGNSTSAITYLEQGEYEHSEKLCRKICLPYALPL